MKKPRKKQRLKELIVREIKRYLDDPDTIEAVTAINYKDGTKTVNYNDMECALSVRLLPRFGFGNRSSFEKYRVFIPAANGSGAFGDVLSTPVIGQPAIGHTETFMSIHENEHTVSVALIFFVPLPLDYAIILMTLGAIRGFCYGRRLRKGERPDLTMAGIAFMIIDRVGPGGKRV